MKMNKNNKIALATMAILSVGTVLCLLGFKMPVQKEIKKN